MEKKQQRLLGIISYYDRKNEFGFINTNGYGITETNDKYYNIELYFRKSDIQDITVVHEGQWVSFIHEKLIGKKRDRARKIKKVTYSEDDYALALNYCNSWIETKVVVDDYETWSKRKHKELVYLEVLPHFTYNFLLKNQSKQFVFNSLIDAYSRHLFDVTELFIGIIDQMRESESSSFDHVDQVFFDNLFSFVINPDKEGIIVNNTEILDDLLSDLSICIFKRINEYRGIDFYPLFSDLINHISDKGLNKTRLAIQAFYDRTAGEDQTRNRQDLDSKLYKMPNETINVLFGSYGFNPSPELRIILYRIQRNVNVLLDNTMIDYWNKLVEENKYPFNFTDAYSYNRTIPQEIGHYLSKSDKPNDLLLLLGFIESKVPDCFRRIKNKSVCYSSALLQDPFYFGSCSSYLGQYLNLAEMIPEDILEKLFNYVGLEKIVGCSGTIDKENYRYFPKSITIQIEVVVTVDSQREFSETVESGGHFTWGEGWQQSYTTYRYLEMNCGATIYVDNPHHHILNDNVQAVKTIIAKELASIISQNKTSCLLTYPTQDQTYLIALYVQESYDADYKLFISSLCFVAKRHVGSE